MDCAETLRFLIEESTETDRVEFVKGLVFQFYTRTLASAQATDFAVPLPGPLADGTEIIIRPVFERPDEAAALLKTMFGRRADQGGIEIVACRAADGAGAEIGLLVLLDGTPSLAISLLGDRTGLLVRQMPDATPAVVSRERHREVGAFSKTPTRSSPRESPVINEKAK